MSFIKPSLPKGTRDFGPETMARRNFIFETLKSAFRKFGYQALETPSMENLSVLTGKYGEEGDRLIFKIINSGDYLGKFDDEKKILDATKAGSNAFTPLISEKALRYDLTVPFARFVAMNQGQLNFPFKRYQIQPVWRADRPQRGRYREFFQCDADVVGSDSLMYEAELAALYAEAFFNLGLKEVRIDLNNRKILTALAELANKPDQVASFCIAIDKIDKIGKEGVQKELTDRGFDSAYLENVFDIIEFEGSNSEKISLLEKKLGESESGKKGIEELKEVLHLIKFFDCKGIEIRLNIALARGLDYYTGTIFEVKPTTVQMGSLGGGGRYDDLTGIFGLKGVSGVGISFGADRIYDVMEESNLFTDSIFDAPKVLVLNVGKDTLEDSLIALKQFRAAGINSEMYPEEAKIAKQFKFAESKKIAFILILGLEEKKEGIGSLKNLQTGLVEKGKIEVLINKLK